MKVLKLLVLGIVLFFACPSQAQVSVSLNIGPAWGPIGYSNVDYYYLPDVEAYYDVPNSMFIYYEGRSWVRRTYLPSRYRNYDLYGGYKVVMQDYHGRTPYYNHREYKIKYAKGYHGPSQRNIGERPGKGYKSKDYRESNQANRGRGTVIRRNDQSDDRSYNRQGNDKHGGGKGDGGHGNGKKK